MRLQWSRYQNSLAQESESERISENWKPSGDLFDILKLAHIDASFAISVLPEFILYWREDGGMYRSCLLYTSPSPRDVEESRMPSSA